jgi:hypothetical protein
LPALAGWLLGYRVVYWPRTGGGGRDGGTCLDGVPLVVTAVVYVGPTGAAHTVRQYSAPAALDPGPPPTPPATMGWRPMRVIQWPATLSAVVL